MSELGERLKKARESQGVSLAQAAVETRILHQSLLALEDGAYQRLPGDVATRGFIRNYAAYLGLSAEEMIELYRLERGATDKIRVIPVTKTPRVRSYVVPSFFGVFFVTIALIGLAYVGKKAIDGMNGSPEVAGVFATATIAPPTPLPSATAGMQAVAPTLPTIPTIPSNQENVPTPTTGIAGAAATSVLAGTPAPGTSATAAAPIVVQINIDSSSGSSGSWLRVQTDGNTTFEGIMRPGEQQTFQAQRRILIRAGNPPAVMVSVNGLSQGRLGQVSGKPVNWSWPP